MINKFFSTALFSMFLLACNTDYRCGDIVNKLVIDGEYTIVVQFGGGTPNDDDVPTISNTIVSLEEYNAYDINDEYCYE